MTRTLERRTDIAGVILAAGASSRLGTPKQLALVGGEALVHRVARTLTASACAVVGVVVGARGAETSEAVAELDVSLIENPGWREGMASSIRAGVRWAERQGAHGLLIAVCDQPWLSFQHVNALLAAFQRSQRAVGSSYAGIVGVPAVFPHADFAQLLQLRGDRGAGSLLRGAVAVGFSAGMLDVDTRRDLELAQRLLAKPLQ